MRYGTYIEIPRKGSRREELEAAAEAARVLIQEVAQQKHVEDITDDIEMKIKYAGPDALTFFSKVIYVTIKYRTGEDEYGKPGGTDTMAAGRDTEHEGGAAIDQ